MPRPRVIDAPLRGRDILARSASLARRRNAYVAGKVPRVGATRELGLALPRVGATRELGLVLPRVEYPPTEGRFAKRSRSSGATRELAGVPGSPRAEALASVKRLGLKDESRRAIADAKRRARILGEMVRIMVE